MWRLVAIGLAAALLVGPATGCKRKRRAATDASQAAPSEPATMLGAADPRAAFQLTRGFHEVENGGWRWSAKNFSAALKPPAGATQKGAGLVLKFSVVDAVLSKLGPMTLTAKVGATQCPPQKYSKPGAFEYRCDIPASTIAAIPVGMLVPVDFSLDKALPASESDQRELGLVVAMVGFEAK